MVNLHYIIKNLKNMKFILVESIKITKVPNELVDN